MSATNILEAPYNFRKKGYIKGYLYAIVQHSTLGHLCGYVRIPRKHPLYRRITNPIWDTAYFSGKYYKRLRGDRANEVQLLRVHGGVTFVGKIGSTRSSNTVDRSIGLGFDCAHLDDIVPGVPADMYSSDDDVFRTPEYVYEQLTSLVDQLITLEK